MNNRNSLLLNRKTKSILAVAITHVNGSFVSEQQLTSTSLALFSRIHQGCCLRFTILSIHIGTVFEQDFDYGAVPALNCCRKRGLLRVVDLFFANVCDF